MSRPKALKGREGKKGELGNYICIIAIISVYPVYPRCMRSAAGGSSGDGSVDVKMLAEQNVQLKEALKRLHTHSIAEKTDVSALVQTSGLPGLTKDSVELSKRVSYH